MKHAIAILALLTAGAASAQTAITEAQISGNATVAASASHTSSQSFAGGNMAGKYSVRNSSGASNISGAAITRKRDGDTYIGIAETWSNGSDFAKSVNRGGIGFADSTQSGSAAATYNSGQTPWLQGGW